MSGDPYKPRGFLSDFERGVYQSVTSRSREFPFPGIIQFFYGFGTGIEKIWYRKKSWNRSRKKLVPKKVSEPVSAKLGTEKSLGIGLEKIWYRKKNIGTSLEIFRLFVLIWVTVSSRSRDFCTFLDGIGTGLEKIWYRKKSRNRSRKNLVPKKSLGIGIVQILGLVTHWCISRQTLNTELQNVTDIADGSVYKF